MAAVVDDLRALPKRSQNAIIKRLPPEATTRRWAFEARPNQLLPSGAWSTWLLLAGRGFGKTRTGSEAIIDWAIEQPRRLSIVGRTAADARKVMVEGSAGILACSPPDYRPHWEPSNHTLIWPNGSTCQSYTAEEPGQLRGPQAEKYWADELAAWFTNDSEVITASSKRRAEAAWSNLQILTRGGTNPQGIVSTTPKPLTALTEMLDDPDVLVTRGALFDNAANLPASYIARMRKIYEGTTLARQELYGEFVEEVEGALWTPDMFLRAERPLPDGRRVVIGLDPSGSDGETGDAIGIVVAAETFDGRGLILEDDTAKRSPEEWAMAASHLFWKWNADEIVAERNYGGDMVRATLHAYDPRLPVTVVTASRGKAQRAAPVSMLYEQGRISHYGDLSALEAELCLFSRAGYQGDKSPNRADALVWALWRLFIEEQEKTIHMPALEEVPMISAV